MGGAGWSGEGYVGCTHVKAEAAHASSSSNSSATAAAVTTAAAAALTRLKRLLLFCQHLCLVSQQRGAAAPARGAQRRFGGLQQGPLGQGDGGERVLPQGKAILFDQLCIAQLAVAAGTTGRERQAWRGTSQQQLMASS